MDNFFMFAGRRSTEFGLVVERFPGQPKPARKVELISIPGRNGMLRIDQGAYENVTVSYECYFKGGPNQASTISGWLYASGGGYAVLRDTYHPDVFRMAAFDNMSEIENVWNRFGRCVLSFDCKPQMWSDLGQKPVEFDLPISSGNWSFNTAVVGVLRNPYPFTAKPLIRLEGYGSSIITIQNAAGSLSLRCETGPYAEIDCEMQNMFIDDINQNTKLDIMTDFPVLAPGENIISMSHKSYPSTGEYPPRLIITPRWWHL